jgi:hypothetical protein
VCIKESKVIVRIPKDTFLIMFLPSSIFPIATDHGLLDVEANMEASWR